MTDAEAEGVPFTEHYLEDIAYLMGADLEDIKQLAAEVEAEIRDQPNVFGWQMPDAKGKMVTVAPSAVDPYLRIKPIATAIFGGMFNGMRDQVQFQERLLQRLYEINYQYSRMRFRSGAFELLERLLDKTAYVVTNSAPGAVRDKIHAISTLLTTDGDPLAAWQNRVIGKAKKYNIDPDFDIRYSGEPMPESMNIHGLSRPVLLRRHLYYDVFDHLMDRHDVEWPDITVVGDIFELDLALPLACGARVGLMVNENTPPYEVGFLEQHERGAVLHDVSEIYGFAYGE
ncbi:MAG: hypothetical protein ABH846_00425 [Patescibacteria group bacterium]